MNIKNYIKIEVSNDASTNYKINEAFSMIHRVLRRHSYEFVLSFPNYHTDFALDGTTKKGYPIKTMGNTILIWSCVDALNVIANNENIKKIPGISISNIQNAPSTVKYVCYRRNNCSNKHRLDDNHKLNGNSAEKNRRMMHALPFLKYINPHYSGTPTFTVDVIELDESECNFENVANSFGLSTTNNIVPVPLVDTLTSNSSV